MFVTHPKMTLAFYQKYVKQRVSDGVFKVLIIITLESKTNWLAESTLV